MAEDIYQACCKNVKELKKHRTQLKLLANKAIRQNNEVVLQTYTKLYALLYSAYAEVSFLKLLHEPNAFSESEIEQIGRQRNLEQKWDKCIELAFSKLNTKANLGQIANKKQQIRRILEEYIIKPSQIRNKIAHGQWMECLNNECTAINPTTTNEILDLDFVKVDRLFEIYAHFHQCILDLLVSQKTHYRDYYKIVTDLDDYIEKTKKWTMESKRKDILSSGKIQRFNKREKITPSK